MKIVSYEAVEPDIEIVVRTGKVETAVFGLFDAGTPDWDVVVGIHSSDTRAGIQCALQLALDALSRATFMETRSLRPGSGGEPLA